jgi:putative ABC transport system permease protein
MAGMGNEIRQAVRRLVRTPVFTVAAGLTLAVAIAANTAIFAVVQRVVLNPLPYPESGDLLRIEHGIPRINVPSGIGMTSGLYYQYQQAHTLEGIAIHRAGEATLVGRGEPIRIQVARTTPTLASVLRVPPALGRWFTDEEGAPGAPLVAILSHGLWVRRFGADPGVLGAAMTLDGVSASVIGVMPASFGYPDARTEVWLPAPISRATGFGLPFGYVGVARLRSAATLAQARAELNGLIRDLPRAYPGDRGVLGNVITGGLNSTPITLKDATVGNASRALWILLAAVGVVLLVACANVANLFLVRSEARQREVAVRRALGASGGSLARFFLTESALLSAAGGVIGLALASGAVRMLVSWGPATLPRLEEIRLDALALGFTAGLTLIMAMVFGTIPLWRVASAAASLTEAGRGNTASRGRHRTRQLLMGGQVALALVLLVASGLMIRSFQNLRAFDPGFNTTSAVTFRVGLPERAYPTRASAVAAHGTLIERLTAIPGVTAVSASTGLPLADACFGNSVLIEGRDLPDDGRAQALARLCAVSSGYIDALGVRLLRGRGIGRDDVEQRLSNVVVNQAFVDTAFAGADPIGRRIRSNAPPRAPGAAPLPPGSAWDGGPPPWLTIVGVVSNTPFMALAERNPTPAVYMPMSLAGGPDIPAIAMLGPPVAAMSYVVRSGASPAALLPAVRAAIDAVNPTLAVSQVGTFEEMLDRASAQMAFTMALLTIAAGVALLLGLVGIYGVVSYIVSQRTGEIGVRIALGAHPRNVARLIVRQSGTVALAGIAVGFAATLAGGRLVESLLYGVTPRDPGVLAGTALALLGVALVACWLPARRAARINPVDTLRAN